MSTPEKAIIANLKENDEGSNSRRKRLKSYTPAFKLEAINFAKETSYEVAGLRFHIHRHTISRWHKTEDAHKML
jgi:transposase-like protein